MRKTCLHAQLISLSEIQLNTRAYGPGFVFLIKPRVPIDNPNRIRILRRLQKLEPYLIVPHRRIPQFSLLSNSDLLQSVSLN